MVTSKQKQRDMEGKKKVENIRRNKLVVVRNKTMLERELEYVKELNY